MKVVLPTPEEIARNRAKAQGRKLSLPTAQTKKSDTWLFLGGICILIAIVAAVASGPKTTTDEDRFIERINDDSVRTGGKALSSAEEARARAAYKSGTSR